MSYGAHHNSRSMARAKLEAAAASRVEPLPALKPRRRNRHIEDDHQASLLEWARRQESVYPQLRLLYANPNGGKRNPREAARMKLQGVKAGLPDLDLPVKSYAAGHDEDDDAYWIRYIGLRIELKRPIVKSQDKPRVSTDQAWWLTELQAAGHCCCLCHGWDQARESILAYLTGKPVPNQWSPK